MIIFSTIKIFLKTYESKTQLEHLDQNFLKNIENISVNTKLQYGFYEFFDIINQQQLLNMIQDTIRGEPFGRTLRRYEEVHIHYDSRLDAGNETYLTLSRTVKNQITKTNPLMMSFDMNIAKLKIAVRKSEIH